MSTVEIRRDILEIEKLRAEIAREREQADTLMRQRLNWDLQERYWRWQQWILLGTLMLGVVGLVFGRFW
ncbi:MAG: hypothetical protein ACREXW_01080 [Gammaproteobacteria bacterium]